MNEYPQVAPSAAQKTASAIQFYLEECSRAERWPDDSRLALIFAENFAPIIREKSNPALNDPDDFGSRQFWKAANHHAVKRWAEEADRRANADNLLRSTLEHIAPMLKLYEPNLPEHPVIAAIRDYLEKP